METTVANSMVDINNKSLLYSHDNRSFPYSHEKGNLPYSQERESLSYSQEKGNLPYSRENKGVTYSHERESLAYSHERESLPYSHERESLQYSHERDQSFPYSHEKGSLPYSHEKENSNLLNDVNPTVVELSPKSVRKSIRPKKQPVHLVDSVTEAKNPTKGLNMAKNMSSKPKQIRVHLYSDFKCDHCGSRYVVNPMRRGNKISTSKYKAAPRHKIDPETQKILTLCNACGLKFGRAKKDRSNKVEISEEDQKKFVEEGERFGKELASKLQNENAAYLFCVNAKKTACGCIQKFICGTETGDSPVSYEEIIERAQLILTFFEKAAELKKMKCYDPNTLETKPGKKNVPKIGLGNGHRKSREFEEFVLSKRLELRNDLKLCEKATQKILSYSNNFLHKRMKTDPEKGIRVERQKGKAAMGMLKPIDDLPLEACCADNCVRMALTHGRLLEVWREKAVSGQVEARRVLAEMLTPSGGNRANCYKFISWVTGCSNTTIGKVNEQMKNTGGDREPPEHGLKKYWRFNPKTRKLKISEATFVPSYQILQTAASSAGLSNMMQDIPQDKCTEPPLTKKMKRQQRKKQKAEMKGKKAEFARSNRLQNTIKIVENTEQTNAANMSSFPSAVIALNGHFPNNSFISIPAGLASENVTIPNTVSLQAFQQQLQQQQQQQLQLQIQFLQQQLQNTQNGCLSQTTTIRQTNEGTTEYIVTPNPIEQNTQSVGTPVVVTVATQPAPVMQNVVAQTLVQNVVNTDIPTIVAQANSNMDFLSSSGNLSILHQQHSNNGGNRTASNISLVASPLRNPGEISIITQNNPGSISVLNTPTHLTETSTLNERVTNSLEAYRQVHLITSQAPPTMAISQPVTISLQTPSISLSSLPTMLLTQSASNDHNQQQQQLIIQQATNHQRQNDQLVIQRGHSTQPNANQLIVHPSSHTVQSNAEQTVAITSSLLPPITSFNADAFLTNGGSNGATTYAVVSNPTLSDIQQPRQVIEEHERHLEHTNTMQVSFIPS